MPNHSQSSDTKKSDPTQDYLWQHLFEIMPIFFPGFEDMLVVRTWAGIMPYTPDGIPILGSVPKLEGFYLATGLCGGGLGTGAVLGQLIANLINHGERPGLFDDTSITRFSDKKD